MQPFSITLFAITSDPEGIHHLEVVPFELSFQSYKIEKSWFETTPDFFIKKFNELE